MYKHLICKLHFEKRYEVEGDWAALGKYFFYGHVTWYGVYPVFSFGAIPSSHTLTC